MSCCLWVMRAATRHATRWGGEHGNQLARPNTLLIDSTQLESGDSLGKNFRDMA